MSDSSQPHGLQPTRLLHPWDFPGNSTGVGCHCLLRPTTARPSFSHHQPLPSGSLLKPLSLLQQRADRSKNHSPTAGTKAWLKQNHHPWWWKSRKLWPRVPDEGTTCCCSVTQSCLTLCDPMDCSMPGLPVPHRLLKFAQVHVHGISDAIQPSHPLMPSSPSALNLSQH